MPMARQAGNASMTSPATSTAISATNGRKIVTFAVEVNAVIAGIANSAS